MILFVLEKLKLKMPMDFILSNTLHALRPLWEDFSLNEKQSK